MLVTAAAVILMTGCNKTSYYVEECATWQTNADGSSYITVASTEKSDVDGSNEFIENVGDMTIVCAKKPNGKLKKILSASEIAARLAIPMTQICDINIFPIPSSAEPETIYFNYIFNGEEFAHSGMANIKTQKFELSEGTIVGMIRKGFFKDCLLRVDNDGVKIIAQAKVGEPENVLRDFNMRQINYRRHNYDLLFDDVYAEEFIRMIEDDRVDMLLEDDDLFDSDELEDLLLDALLDLL